MARPTGIIDTNHYRVTGKQVVTLKDVAARCGVHFVTVSRALRGDTRNVSQEEIARISAIAAEMGYDPSRQQAARRLALSKRDETLLNHVIGVFFPPNFMAASYFSTLFQGIMEVLEWEGFGLLMTHTYSPRLPSRPPGSSAPPDTCLIPPAYARGDVDGMIALANPRLFEHTLARLQQTVPIENFPSVFLLTGILPGCANVLIDNQQGAYLAAVHLLDLGHRDILFLRYPEGDYTSDQRLKGYTQAYQERGINPQLHLHPVVLQSKETMPDIMEAFPTAMRNHPETTAVLAYNDRHAIYLNYYFSNNGLRVPEDISIVGFDDSDSWVNAQGEKMLTTVHVPSLEIGRIAAQEVIRMVQERMVTRQTTILPTHLVVRASTAPPRLRTSML
jgi:LacI family transcriptional regulator